MNTEIRTALVKNNEGYTFTFSQPVKEYMVGFSKFTLQYKDDSHHIKKISIDLSDCRQEGNNVIVKPSLVFIDKHKGTKPGDMPINIVVIATVGAGNPNIQLHNGLNANFENRLPTETAIIKSAILSANAQFNNDDHHLYKFQATVTPSLNGDKFNIDGNAIIADRHGSSTGSARGSAVIFNRNDPEILCKDFDSRNIGCFGPIFFDFTPQGFNPDDYEVACLINGVQVSFDEGTDHHILKIDAFVDMPENKLSIKAEKACVVLRMNAYLADNGVNKFNTPHNVVKGFVIAFKKNH